MPAQWTAEAVGQMHLKKVTSIQLAKAIGWHPKYLSAVMNGHRSPVNAQEKIMSALASFPDPNATTSEDQ